MKKTNYKWFYSTEIVLVIGSISSSVASIVFQQAAFAAIGSIPLSLAVSFNSYNRKQLDKLTQQHQVSITQLEQQFSNNREFLSSLPNHSELADTESRLEARNTAFAQQLDSLEKQLSRYLELQQFNNQYNEVADVQQRILAVEKSLKTYYKPEFLYVELQNSIAGLEAKIKKLEQQFNNLPVFDLQDRTTQVEQLINSLQANAGKVAQIYNLLLQENQLINQQVQALTNKTEALSLLPTEEVTADLKISLKNSTELNQKLIKEFESLSQQVKAVSSGELKEVAALRVELQSQLSYIEKSERKIYANIHELKNRCKKLEDKIIQSFKENSSVASSKQINQKQRNEKVFSKEMNYVCEHCNRSHETQPIKGGYFLQSNFCGQGCKREYERMNGLL